MLVISHFNRIIRSRILWGFFAVVICVSFVGAFSAQPAGCTRNAPSGAGLLYGKNVSEREFTLARYFAMGMREVPGMSEETHERVRKATWQRLAALRTAERLKIGASANEIREQMRRDPSFQVNNVFNRARYLAVLAAQRIDPSIFEEYLRQEVTLRKLNRVMESAVWTSPSELRQRIENLTDVFTLQCVELRESEMTPEVTVTEEQARTFFAAHPDVFRVPEKVAVRYVEFQPSNFLAAATIADERIQEHYTNHIDRYSRVDTNGQNVVRPLSEVGAEILSELKREEAQTLAKDTATRFVVDLAPDRQGRAPQFEAVAARYDLAVRTTGLFTADADVPGLKASRRFNREAFRLDKDDPERYFSDAVTDEDVVFVLAAHQRHEAYQPAFTNVMDVAVYIARSNAMHEAFLAKAGTIADAARAGVASQQTFAVSLKAFGLSVTTNLTFSPYAAMSEKTWHAETLVPAVMPLSAGEVSKPLPIEGGALIACVAKRTEGDAVEAELLRPQLVASIDRYRAGVMFGEWASHIMRSDAGFKDLNAAPAASSTNAGADAEAP